MKQFAIPVLLLSVILLASSWMNSPKKKKKKGTATYLVTGTVTETRSYCGGAAPGPEQLESAKTPRAVSFARLYVKKGSTNSGPVIDTIVADQAGKFSINLPPGTYCLVEKWKTVPYVTPVDSKYITYDTACYRQLFHACDYTLEVKKNTSNVIIAFHRPCDWNRPCERYDGPLPPSAPPGRSGQPGHQE